MEEPRASTLKGHDPAMIQTTTVKPCTEQYIYNKNEQISVEFNLDYDGVQVTPLFILTVSYITVYTIVMSKRDLGQMNHH